MKKTLIKDFGIPLLILIVITLIFRLTNLDINLQKYFYDPAKGWFLPHTSPIWNFLYNYGTYPALLLILLQFIFLLLVSFQQNI